MLKAPLKALVILLSFETFSHPAPSPTNSAPASSLNSGSSNTLSDGDLYGGTTGGYGYLCAGEFCSEAEAVNQLDLSCDADQVGNLLKKLCPDYDLDLPSNSPMLKNLERISSKTFLKHLQSNLFEYLKLSSITNPARIRDAEKS